jgi:hypothetical protein
MEGGIPGRWARRVCFGFTMAPGFLGSRQPLRPAWTVEEAAHFAALRDFELLQLTPKHAHHDTPGRVCACYTGRRVRRGARAGGCAAVFEGALRSDRHLGGARLGQVVAYSQTNASPPHSVSALSVCVGVGPGSPKTKKTHERLHSVSHFDILNGPRLYSAPCHNLTPLLRA